MFSGPVQRLMGALHLTRSAESFPENSGAQPPKQSRVPACAEQEPDVQNQDASDLRAPTATSVDIRPPGLSTSSEQPPPTQIPEGDVSAEATAFQGSIGMDSHPEDAALVPSQDLGTADDVHEYSPSRVSARGQSITSLSLTPYAESTRSRYTQHSRTGLSDLLANDPHRVPLPSSPSESDEILRLWDVNAFVSKMRSYVALQSQVTQLRRSRLQLRRELRSSVFPSISDFATRNETQSDMLSDATNANQVALEEVEMQLDLLDEQLLRDGEAIIAAGPDVYNLVRRRRPMMIPKHQIDFRGEASTSSFASTADLEQNLEGTALELVKKIHEIGDTEDEILSLRHTMVRLEERAELNPDEDAESPIQLQESIEDVNQRIGVAVSRLKVLRAELEMSRAVPASPGLEVPRELIPDPNAEDGSAVPLPPWVSISNDGTLVQEYFQDPEKAAFDEQPQAASAG